MYQFGSVVDCQWSVVLAVLSDLLFIVRLTKIKQSFYLRLPTAALHTHKHTHTHTCQQILEGNWIRDACALVLRVNSPNEGECKVKDVAVDVLRLGAKKHS